jgi:hypothetical protein
VAAKLNAQYGFSYDKLKVLLGGWSAWTEANAQDPNAYPIETGPNPGLLRRREEGNVSQREPSECKTGSGD